MCLMVFTDREFVPSQFYSLCRMRCRRSNEYKRSLICRFLLIVKGISPKEMEVDVNL